jgi:hypothetical protein
MVFETIFSADWNTGALFVMLVRLPKRQLAVITEAKHTGPGTTPRNHLPRR